MSTLDLPEMGKLAKEASLKLAQATTGQKNHALERLAKNLSTASDNILSANAKDLNQARASGMSDAMLDRLRLDGRLEGIVEDIRRVASLPDPVGKILEQRTLENGLKLTKRRTPIGVLGVIYESRPNVTLDVSALAIKTGNCAILRGGSETLHSNIALTNLIHRSLSEAGIPESAIQLIDSPDRALVKKLLKLHDCINLIIPRGGAGLHQFCRENSSIPVITGGIGICHLFVDETADLVRSLEVVHNAKTQRPTVCNALDTLLVHKEVAASFVPRIIEKLRESGVSFRADSPALELAGKTKDVFPAGEEDWDTEWLSLTLGLKIVESIEEALSHIQKHSSGHSDGILTEDRKNAERFVQEVDSSSVYVNASTRFTDGSQFGLGAEVAISTQKLHARGPMGLEELTTYKWVVEGDYHIRP